MINKKMVFSKKTFRIPRKQKNRARKFRSIITIEDRIMYDYATIGHISRKTLHSLSRWNKMFGHNPMIDVFIETTLELSKEKENLKMFCSIKKRKITKKT